MHLRLFPLHNARNLFSMFSSWPKPHVSGVHCPKRFRQILERERSRADRTGGGFWLIVFTAPPDRSGQQTMQALVKRLRKRLRLVDEVGWLDSRRLAALLPTTSSSGVSRIGEEMLATVSPRGRLPAYDLYYYPTGAKASRKVTETAEAAESEAYEVAHSLAALFVRPLPPWKRGLDVLGAMAGMVVLSPLFVLAALAVKATSPGPVLFRQQRAGLGGRPFTLYKLRSMVVGAEKQKSQLLQSNEQEGPVFKIQHDPRVTPVGRLLRSSSIDELPQLWNVLKGDMSLVGPRPLPMDESQGYEPWQRQRQEVTPGLTCIWQVSGRSEICFTSWMRMDHQYIRSRSLMTDAKLLLKTIPAVLLQRGAC